MTDRTIRPDVQTLDRHHFVPHYIGVISNALIWSQSRFFLEAFGFGVNEVRVITVLADCGELSGRGFCDALMMNKSIVSRTLRELEEKKLVWSPGEGRNRKYQLTEEGYALNAKIVKISLEREKRLLRGFSRRDKVILLGYLAQMVENLEHAGDFYDLIEGLDMHRDDDDGS
ncbi:MarR family winged helix-turn-helix transcriptional regulator [Croceicoccus bisphenolivorans]|uniref:MarR family winged helix-turn-helix transcriptional regulator n=1 Tax=Croceicoccus bisphenolivorans TaxID=1783232 RepID=UPI00082B1C93|nr:MarR family winged helix-turn-helix transcriptional regulator [Croceicoccus bisphenolivorans]